MLRKNTASVLFAFYRHRLIHDIFGMIECNSYLFVESITKCFYV